jgi:hypothetical protein
MTVTCPHGLVSATHPVRLLQAVAGRLDLKQSYEPIQARRGVAGRDATDPRLPAALWLYACARHRLGPRAGAPLGRQRGLRLVVRRRDGESSPAVGFPHRSRRWMRFSRR